MKSSNLSLQIFSEMCPEQEQDLKELLELLDDFSAATFALSSSSPQAYTTFIDARNNIRKQFQDKFKNYRLVVEV
jgi:molecular chaperone GrpE (heat shock protein)